MKKFRIKDIIEDLQYFAKDNLSFEKIVRSEPIYRFDDTPN